MEEQNAPTNDDQNEEVEETTGSEASTEETDQEEAPETEEETDSDEADADEDDSSTDEDESEEDAEEDSEAETQEQEGEKQKQSGTKRQEKAIQRLLRDRAKLREQLAGQGQPAGQQQGSNITPQQAAQGAQIIEEHYQRTGTLPESITPEFYQHLVAVRDGQAQAQTDYQNAGLEKEVLDLRQKVEISDRVQEINEEYSEVLSASPELDPSNPEFDAKFEEQVGKQFERALKTNPKLNVKEFLSDKVEIYRLAQSKGGEKVSATLAKQAAGAAIGPRGKSKTKAKDIDDPVYAASLTAEQLQAEIEKKHGRAR